MMDDNYEEDDLGKSIQGGKGISVKRRYVYMYSDDDEEEGEEEDDSRLCESKRV